MNKTKDTGYLFAKMTSSGEGNINASDKQDVKPQIAPTRTYHFEENGQAKEEQNLKKWILDNVMLLVTLTGVLTGVVAGTVIE